MASDWNEAYARARRKQIYGIGIKGLWLIERRGRAQAAGGIEWIECKKRSDVWKHLLIDKNKKDEVKCKKCPTIIYNYKSATTNMWKHLERKHLMTPFCTVEKSSK